MEAVVRGNRVLVIGQAVIDNDINFKVKTSFGNTYCSKNDCEVVETDMQEDESVENLKYKNGKIVKVKYSKKDFILLFSKQEWSKFKKLCATDEAAEQYYDAIMSADYIDLEDKDIVNDIGYMVQKGVLTVDRMKKILGE